MSSLHCQSEIEGHCPCERDVVVTTFVNWIGPVHLCLQCYTEYYTHDEVPTIEAEPIGAQLLQHLLHYWKYDTSDTPRRDPIWWQYVAPTPPLGAFIYDN